MKTFSDVILERRFFAKNSFGESEFDWILKEFGFTKKEAELIDEVTINGEVFVGADD